jgi:amidase
MEHIFMPQKYYYSLGMHEPALKIRSGDTIITWTVDARNDDSDGKPIPKKNRYPAKTGNCEISPLNGPIYISDTKETDTLAVHIDRINLTRDYAISAFSAGYGGLQTKSLSTLSMLSVFEPFPNELFKWILDREAGIGRLKLKDSKISHTEIKLHPFIGTMGTAPQFGQEFISLVPAEHGGNMDCSEVSEGATLYLPVFTKGAFLFLGDVHAAQGDGEVAGVALETTAEIHLTIKTIKNKVIRWPRIENKKYLMTVGSSGTTENALRIAFTEMIEWMSDEFGFDQWEAIEVLTQTCKIQIANVCNPNHSTVVKIPKDIIK